MLRRIQRYVLFAAGAALLAVAAACTASLDESPVEVGVTDVEVRDNNFSARVIEVEPGTEVTWTWVGEHDHNVRGDAWGSEVMADGAFAHRFEEPGTYDYVCTLHGGMDGRVIVAAGGGEEASGE